MTILNTLYFAIICDSITNKLNLILELQQLQLLQQQLQRLHQRPHQRAYLRNRQVLKELQPQLNLPPPQSLQNPAPWLRHPCSMMHLRLQEASKLTSMNMTCLRHPSVRIPDKKIK